jgi:hypothetical protein
VETGAICAATPARQSLRGLIPGSVLLGHVSKDEATGVARSRPRRKGRCGDCRTRGGDVLPIGARRHAGLSLEEPVEIAGIAKTKAVGDLLDRKFGVLQPKTGFLQKTLMDQLQRRAARAPAAGVVQMGAGDAEHFGEGPDREAIPIVQLDELPEALHRRCPGAPDRRMAA